MTKSLQEIKNQMKKLVEDTNIPSDYSERYVIGSSDGYIQEFEPNLFGTGLLYTKYTNDINLAKAYPSKVANKIVNYLNTKGQDEESPVFGMKFWIRRMDDEVYLTWKRYKERRYKLHAQLMKDL